MEYLLDSACVHLDSHKVTEGVLIQDTSVICRLVEKIIGVLSTMLPHRDLEEGFVEQSAQGPIRPTVTRSQRLEPYVDFQFNDDELATKFGGSYRHYTVGYAHHFSFDTEIEDFISRRCRLAPVSYHPLGDRLAPSFENKIGSSKLLSL